MSEPIPNTTETCIDNHGNQYTRSDPAAPWVLVVRSQPGVPQMQLPSFGETAPGNIDNSAPFMAHGPWSGAHSGAGAPAAFTGPPPGLFFFPPPNEMLPASQSGVSIPRPNAEINAASSASPEDLDDDNLPPAHKLTETVARPAVKVAGVRRVKSDAKGKGKQRAESTPGPSKRKASAAHSPRPEKKQKGRNIGSSNFSKLDIDLMEDVLEEDQPLGSKGWNSSADKFSALAKAHGRPARNGDSLKRKFEQLIKTTKPTGDAECPPHIERALHIEHLMNNKGGSRDLDDEDIVDVDDSPDSDAISISDDDINENTPPQPPVKVKTEKVDTDKLPAGGTARRPLADRLPPNPRARRSTGQDFLATISSAIDPAAQVARSEEASARTMQASQIFSLTSQLREVQRSNDTLRAQLSNAERERHDAERRADSMAHRLEMMELLSARDRAPQTPHHRRSSPPRHRHRSRSHRRRRSRSSLDRGNTYWQEVVYPDGGRATRLVDLDSPGQQADASGFHDEPGVERYTVGETDTFREARASRRDNQRPMIRPPSPFRSALNTIESPDINHHTHRSHDSTSTHTPALRTFSQPSGDIGLSGSGVSIVVSPLRNTDHHHQEKDNKD